jgi:hypothetical protein
MAEKAISTLLAVGEKLINIPVDPAFVGDIILEVSCPLIDPPIMVRF